MQIGLRHLLLAFLASLALHALAGLWLPAPKAGAQGPGEGGLLISLAADGGAAAEDARATASETPDPNPPKEPEYAVARDLPKIPPSNGQPERESASEAPPIMESPLQTDLPAEPEEAQRPTARPETLPSPTKSAQAASAPAATQEAAVPPPSAGPGEGDQATASSAASGSTSSSSASGTAGGDPGAFNAYLAELLAWLARHKTYPAVAERRRQEGTSEIVFTVARDGSLLSYELARSSGHALLDAASEEMLRRAAPLPPIPPEISGERLKITAPVVFQLQ
ncbi:MAG: TonB family protein [Rhodovibrionaceae bacterium]